MRGSKEERSPGVWRSRVRAGPGPGGKPCRATQNLHVVPDAHTFEGATGTIEVRGFMVVYADGARSGSPMTTGPWTTLCTSSSWPGSPITATRSWGRHSSPALGLAWSPSPPTSTTITPSRCSHAMATADMSPTAWRRSSRPVPSLPSRSRPSTSPMGHLSRQRSSEAGSRPAGASRPTRSVRSVWARRCRLVDALRLRRPRGPAPRI